MGSDIHSTVRVRFDVSWDFPVQDFFEGLASHGGTIHHFIAHGPAGGNPCITADFPSKEEAVAYLNAGGYDTPAHEIAEVETPRGTPSAT